MLCGSEYLSTLTANAAKNEKKPADKRKMLPTCLKAALPEGNTPAL